MQGKEELLEFPCDFPIKVMGRDDGRFRQVALDIVKRHFELNNTAISEQPSRNGRFVSLTFTVNAIDRGGLDALYEELSADKHVLIAL
ncbi:MAG: DUF493 domain-containing protein [Gammaproteobacteria bacterium]